MAMADINSFVYDRAIRGAMLDPNTKEVLWTLNQIREPNLSVTTENQQPVDAIDVPIMTIYRAKTLEFSGENALWDLPLMAAQGGTKIVKASDDTSVIVPIFDEITIGQDGATATSVTLRHTPYTSDADGEALQFIYLLSGDGSISKKFEVAEAAAAGKFAISEATVTFNDGDLKTGDKILAIYDYEADGSTGGDAMVMTHDGVTFPTAGIFVLECLVRNPCDKATLYYAYFEMPSAQLSPDFDMTFAADMTHPFTIQAFPDYCDPEKRLLRVIVPELTDAA